jgi:hypothetical protein
MHKIPQPTGSLRLKMRFTIALIAATALTAQLTVAAVKTAKQTGTWEDVRTWKGGAFPVAGDSVVIPQGITVEVGQTNDYTRNAGAMSIDVYGNLNFQHGRKIVLPCLSSVTLHPGGSINAGDAGVSGSQEMAVVEMCGKALILSKERELQGYRTWKSETAPSSSSVKWSSCKVNRTEHCNAIISWSTSSETDNYSFTVERSGDGSNYEPIGTIKGNGTTSESKFYTFSDANPLGGTSYYRIRQNSRNGGSSYSAVNMLHIDSDPKSGISVSPDTRSGNITVSVSGIQSNEKWRVLVFDNTGKMISRNIQVVNESTTIIPASLTSLQPGDYTVIIHRPQGVAGYNVALGK